MAKSLVNLTLPQIDDKFQTATNEFLTVVRERQDGINQELPELPAPLNEQRRIVARIEALAGRIAEAQSLRQSAAEEANVLFQSRLNELLTQKVETKSWEMAHLPEFVANNRHSIKRGPFGSHLRKEFFVPSGYKVYEQKHAIYGDFNAGDYFVDEDKFREMKAFEVKRWGYYY